MIKQAWEYKSEVARDLNNTRGEFKKISANDSKIDVYVIPTNEELLIARDTVKLIEQ